MDAILVSKARDFCAFTKPSRNGSGIGLVALVAVYEALWQHLDDKKEAVSLKLERFQV